MRQHGVDDRAEIRCAGCGYGAIVARLTPCCPMCGSTSWEAPSAGRKLAARGEADVMTGFGVDARAGATNWLRSQDYSENLKLRREFFAEVCHRNSWT